MIPDTMILELILLFQTVSFSEGDVILLVLTFDRNVYIDLVDTGFYRALFVSPEKPSIKRFANGISILTVCTMLRK